MSLAQTYARALDLLLSRPLQAWGLALAGVGIALVQLAEPILFGRVIDTLSGKQDAAVIILLWAGLGLFGIIAGALLAVASDILAHERRLNAMGLAFERAMTLPISYHAERGSGAVVRSILAGTDALFWLWLNFLREQLTAIVGVACLVPTAMYMDWRLASILLVLAAVYAAANIAIMIKTSTGQGKVERFHSEVYSRVGDVLGNVTIVQSYARLRAEARAMSGIMNELLTAQRPLLTWWGILTVLTRSASTVAMVTVLAVGSLLAQRGEISVGQIVAFVAFAQLLIGKLDQISGFIVQIYQHTPVIRTFLGLLDERTRVQERSDAAVLENVKGAVAFQNVSYRYGMGKEGVFDLSFMAEPGETVALVGPTGAGKTTALALLQRLRDPHQGHILVDGYDITTVTIDSLRHAIGVVFQDAGLFNRTIEENIRVGRPDATFEEIEQAARLAQAHDFVMEKPGGYQFVIGERGASLSGGERQRIAIARAILKNAPILILDEATSALDAQTERRIKEAVAAVSKGRTTFIIAHRLSTVAAADQILVLNRGRIIERGTFSELVRKGGLFADLVRDGSFNEPEQQAQPAETGVDGGAG
jgi:ATP-binding cassette subfamily B protein